MKKTIFSIIIITCFISVTNAQDTAAPKETTKKFMQITTIESVIGGGFARSKMIITKEDGTQEDRDMETSLA